MNSRWEERAQLAPAGRISVLYVLFSAAWLLFTRALLPQLAGHLGAWQSYELYVFAGLGALVIYAAHRELPARRPADRDPGPAERSYRWAFEGGVAAVFRTTPDGEILDCNEALAELLGFDRPRELLGTNARSYYVDPSQRDEWVRRLREEGSRIRNHEIHLQRADGTDVWALMNAMLLRREEGEPALVGTLVNITEERQLRDQLEAYAYQDSTTGLPNRRYLRQKASEVLSKARRDESPVGLLYMDLDRFKRINDTLGHDVGDDLLHRVGRRLLAHVRTEDMVARVGGDEFAVLLNTIEDEEGARAAAERLREDMSAPFYVRARSLHLEVTVGIALFPDHGTAFHDLLSRADRAMGRARAGEVRVAVHAPPESRAGRDALAEEEELRHAIEADHFRLHYQPVYRVGSGDAVGAEALARWRHPEVGIRRPGEFIAVAERSGLIRQIDRWAARTVTGAVDRFTRAGPLDWLSFNLSAASLEDEDAFRDILTSIGSRQRGDVVVEITESGAMRDPGRNADRFRELQARGAQVAIDDFGTGHSALAHLKKLPTDLVKLDMIFLRGIDQNERDDQLLRALIELSKTLEVSVAAEGVEREVQLDRLEEHGCHLAQGYYFGRPVPAAELEGVL